MSKLTIALISLSTLVISGCGGVQSELKDLMRCSIVAENLEQTTASENIQKQFLAFVIKNPEVENMKPFELMQIVNEIKYNDLRLNGDVQYAMEQMIDTYNSSTCRKMHKQDKISLQELLPR